MSPVALLLLAAAASPEPVPVDAALLAGLPATEAVLTAHGRTLRCSGPTLVSVLEKIGLPFGKALHGPELARGVVAHARDGYAVLFSLGELDPGTGATRAIVATACEGKPISAAEGPYRLIVPTDRRPARSVRQLASLEPR